MAMNAYEQRILDIEVDIVALQQAVKRLILDIKLAEQAISLARAGQS